MQGKPTPLWIRFGRVKEDTGHTIIHWLYTGEYDNLPDSSEQGSVNQEELEYKQSVHTHCAAYMYVILGLEKLAEQKMKSYEESVDIRHVLGVARGVFPLFRSRDHLPPGYQDHLRKRLASAIQDDKDLLRLNMFIGRMGQVPDFDMFVLENLALIFSVEVSMLQQKVRSEKFAKWLLRENKDGSQ